MQNNLWYMTYTAFEPRVLPIFIYYIILSVFGVLITIQMIKKWREREEIPPLYLSIVFALLVSAIIVLAIGLAEAAITGFYKEIYRFSLPLAYSLVVLADIVLFKFANHITDKAKKAFIPIIILGAVLIVMIFLPWNWWGFPYKDYAGKLNIRLYTNIYFVAYSFIVYISIAFISLRTKKMTREKIPQVGLTLLFYSMIAMIMFFVMILADNVMIVVFNHPGYSEFIYIAWIFAILFLILSYLSLVMPNWLVKRIQKNNKSE